MGDLKIRNDRLRKASYYLLQHHPFYAEIFLSCNLSSTQGIPTAGVNTTEHGFNFHYNGKFLDSLTPNQMNFVMIHEIYHLLSNHLERMQYKGYVHSIANIAADMVVNSDIKDRYCARKECEVDAPQGQEETLKDITKENSRNGRSFTGYYIPSTYQGPKTMEALYEWINNDPSPEAQKLKQQAEAMDGQGTFDEHLEDTVPPEFKDELIKDAIARGKQRGIITSDIDELIHKLRPPKKNYLKLIRSTIELMGSSNKRNTWKRPGRRHEFSRGFVRQKKAFNVILDVSGSMHGSFEKALSYIFKSGYEINLYQIDTEVKASLRIKTKNQLQKMRIAGCGGTTLQPAIDRIREESNKLSTIILTDGWTDHLDFAGIKKDVLILSVDQECPVSSEHACKVRQYVIEEGRSAS